MASDATPAVTRAAADPGASAPDNRLALVQRFFEGTGASYDAMVQGATLGIDGLWKRRIVECIPPDARRILDLACGTGISTLAIAAARPRAQVVGVELRDEYLAFARAKLAGNPNVTWVLSRAEDYADPEPFDCIASSYLAKYADLPRLIRGNRAMLAPGGTLVMHDFMLPTSGVLRAVWRAYFMLMQQTVARAFPAWKEIYHGLPKLIETTRWLHELPALLEREGFEDVRVVPLTLQGSALVCAERRRHPAAPCRPMM